MTESGGLRTLGRPDVRNSILLNEIGVLMSDVGKLSAEFIRKGPAFPHHLVLRRLTRAKDPRLGGRASASSALRAYCDELKPGSEEDAVAQLLLNALVRNRDEAAPWSTSIQLELEKALASVRENCTAEQEQALQQVTRDVRQMSANLASQREQEEAIGAIEPPFISVEGFYEGLDQLPFVADLVEMQGRTWHPQALEPPEVKLLRTLRRRVQPIERATALAGEGHLYAVRELYCEALSNQLLEINNIRKDGPGDLGSWFWKRRLYPAPEDTLALLDRFDEGASLCGEEREAVRWLGLRPMTKWAYSKILLSSWRSGGEISLWEHSYRLASLHKSVVAQALTTGDWPAPASVAWRVLQVGLGRPATGALEGVKALIEVEYPLGNEIHRDESSIQFTFPGLRDEKADELVRELGKDIISLVGVPLSPRISVGPMIREWCAPA